MTEKEWLACADVTPMLEFLRGKASERKFRLFACACCRSLFPLITDKYSRQAVKVAERYADGEVSSEKLRFAWGSARRAAQTRRRSHRHDDATAEDFALWAVALAIEENPARMVWFQDSINWALVVAKRLGLLAGNSIDEAGLLRDIFRPRPFAPVTIDTSWRTSTVTQLAAGIYQDRAFDHLPILADALEEAGCANDEILGHCRGPGPHARGCWVIDLLLAKE